MEVVMKKLLIALVILSSLVSCGKKNVAGNTGSLTSAISIGNLPVQSQQVASQLGSIVTNNQFGVGQATYYETWNQYVAHAPNTTYNYGTMAAAQNNSGCHTVATIFYVCSSSSSSSPSTTAISRSVVHSSVNVLDKQNAIIAIINRTNYIQSAGNGVFYIVTTDNATHVIDTKLPIQANPVQTSSANATGETLINVQ
jgi:hypothetical protein